MAHVVGVPRRDPCQKCKLPVFLAERLTVGKKVYHRTCLKCARCRSQLTPGSFYETEVDDEYCCETCPDEELETALQGAVASTTSPVQLRIEEPVDAEVRARPARSSIAARLAFFEQSNVGGDSAQAQPSTSALDAKLLQKSVSDEEKSKSLKKTEIATPYKLNSALSSFLHDTIDGANAEDDIDSEATSSAANTCTDTGNKIDMETTDSENEAEELSLESQKPELPRTRPPLQAVEELSSSTAENVKDLKIAEQQQELSPKYTATAQLSLTNNWSEPKNEEENAAPVNLKTTQHFIKADSVVINEQTTPTKKTELKFQLTTPTSTSRIVTIDKINNNNAVKNNKAEDSAFLTPLRIMEDDDEDDDVQIHLESKLETNDNDYVTKEESVEIDVAHMSAVVKEKASNVVTIESTEMEIEPHNHNVHADNASKALDEDVELRAKSESPTNSPHKLVSKEDTETTKRLSVVRARLHQFEVIANNNENIPELDKDKENKNVNAQVNTSNSFIDKEPMKFIELQEDAEKVKAIDVSTNLIEIEKILKQVPKEKEDDIEIKEEKVSIAATEDNMKNENVEQIKEEIPMEVEALVQAAASTVTLLADTVAPTGEIDANVVENLIPTASTIALSPKQDSNLDVALTPMEDSSQPIVATIDTCNKTNLQEYPEDLNPFKSDDDEEDANEADKENFNVLLRTPAPRNLSINSSTPKSGEKKNSTLNPFDSSDDEIELEKTGSRASTAATTPSGKVPPPRPPPPRLSRNPFGDDNEEDTNFSRRSSLTSSVSRRTPVPTPRSNVSQSQNPTPEPTPRLSNKKHSYNASPVLHNASDDYYGSANSLSATPHSLLRNSDIRGSNNSLSSSAGGTIRSRKSRRAPAPPSHPTVKELFPNADESIAADLSSQPSTPSSSTVGSPKQGRKKRLAPAPPKPARLDPAQLPPTITVGQETPPPPTTTTTEEQSKNSLSYPLQSELDSKLSDEEKALLEGNLKQRHLLNDVDHISNDYQLLSQRSSLRMIPLDASLLLDEDGNSFSANSKCDDVKHQEHEEEFNVVYRRVLVPPLLDTPTHEANPLLEHLNATHDRQLEKLKDNKEAKNRNRQSQISAASSGAEDSDPLYNKSAHGKWKRRKGPAPALPVPPRKVLQMLPLQEIKHELEIIEVQQQGLEKQGVVLEKMIRDRCEGENGEPLSSSGNIVMSGDIVDGKAATVTENSKEVEDLILQLFELVNEKNELFRRQAELMYLRRQHRLEQEQADIEYEIRVLMAQPERNKTDTDKSREEALIARLVEVVQLRNEVIESLEMDRLREAEEDMSIKKRLELHTAQREGDGNTLRSTIFKLSKKEKKKHKETKKFGKSKKLDADKDADESELNSDKLKTKKKKKKFLF